ncbi:MAG TPA: protein-L-isoaspartate(D-aspartate) O-methyltransferase [Streptosporangiaceae bacterium]|nr:protein-L-isoaspartate(D-aspartate) O-methyltransferase [Streptosporangiaceae bacterium]
MQASADDLAQAARAAGVTSERVLAAIAATPRAAFAPAGHAGAAYSDRPLPIERGLVTTQPSLVAIMIAGLELAGDEQVLEIGAGYGYQTALLARLAAHVTSIEIYADIASVARRNLSRQGIANVQVVVADGTRGYPAGAPFDAVLVSAAHPAVPRPLIDQLREGGRLVQPIGPGGNEDVTLFVRTADGLRHVRVLTMANFVPLRGKYGSAHPT